MSELERADLAWCRIGDQLIFLDIAKDRYFRLPGERNRSIVDFLDASSRKDWQQPAILPRPENWQFPQQASPSIGTGQFRLAEVARALWVQRRIEKRLASRPFAAVLAELRLLVTTRTADTQSLGGKGADCVRGFEYARLFRTAANHCLPRSIALASCLAARGVRSHLVLGVRTLPFAAHCWVQQGTSVLNDSLEEVQRFHPILVV